MALMSFTTSFRVLMDLLADWMASISPAALNALAIAPPYDVRQGSNFIDEEGALDLALTSDEDENDDEGYDSQIEADAWEESMTRVDDEDWEIAEGGT